MRNFDPHCPHFDFDATYGFAGETIRKFREPIKPCGTHGLPRTDRPKTHGLPRTDRPKTHGLVRGDSALREAKVRGETMAVNGRTPEV